MQTNVFLSFELSFQESICSRSHVAGFFLFLGGETSGECGAHRDGQGC